MDIKTNVSCKVCKAGNIVERIVLKYGEHNGIIGPGGSAQRYVANEGFHCENCGVVHKPTKYNRLIPSKPNDDIEDIIMNSGVGVLSRSLKLKDIAAVGKTSLLSDSNLNFTKGKEIFIPTDRHQSLRGNLHPTKYFLVRKGGKMVVVDDATKYREKNVKMVKKIGNVKLDKPTRQATLEPYKPKIPKNAVPADMIFLLDKDFKKQYFYIPKDAIAEKNI